MIRQFGYHKISEIAALKEYKRKRKQALNKKVGSIIKESNKSKGELGYDTKLLFNSYVSIRISKIMAIKDWKIYEICWGNSYELSTKLEMNFKNQSI